MRYSPCNTSTHPPLGARPVRTACKSAQNRPFTPQLQLTSSKESVSLPPLVEKYLISCCVILLSIRVLIRDAANITRSDFLDMTRSDPNRLADVIFLSASRWLSRVELSNASFRGCVLKYSTYDTTLHTPHHTPTPCPFQLNQTSRRNEHVERLVERIKRGPLQQMKPILIDQQRRNRRSSNLFVSTAAIRPSLRYTHISGQEQATCQPMQSAEHIAQSRNLLYISLVREKGREELQHSRQRARERLQSGSFPWIRVGLS
jgi:hypothetical protein